MYNYMSEDNDLKNRILEILMEHTRIGGKVSFSDDTKSEDAKKTYKPTRIKQKTVKLGKNLQVCPKNKKLTSFDVPCRKKNTVIRTNKELKEYNEMKQSRKNTSIEMMENERNINIMDKKLHSKGFDKKVKSMTIPQLRKEIKKHNVVGFSKMKKSELVDLILKNRIHFKHIINYPSKEKKQMSEERKEVLREQLKKARAKKANKKKSTPNRNKIKMTNFNSDSNFNSDDEFELDDEGTILGNGMYGGELMGGCHSCPKNDTDRLNFLMEYYDINESEANRVLDKLEDIEIHGGSKVGDFFKNVWKGFKQGVSIGSKIIPFIL